VVAVLVSISAGITVTFWTALAAYAVAAGLATLMASAEGRAPALAPSPARGGHGCR
jgi:hypothetical protein